jgi:hypothetical protein
LREFAENAILLPPPPEPRLRELIKGKKVADNAAIDVEGSDFDIDNLLDYLVEHDCREEVKSVMKLNLPREDLGLLWFVAVDFDIEYVIIEMKNAGYNMNERCAAGSKGINEYTALGMIVKRFSPNNTDVDRENMIGLFFILDLGVDVNFQCGETGWTALMVASQHGSLPVIKCLLDHGADPSIVDKDGRSVLMYACLCNHVKVARFWIKRGIPIDTQDCEGHSALLAVVVFRPSESLELVQLLLEKSANADIQNYKGWTALLCASYKNYQSTVQLLLNHGADKDLKDDNGKTALDLAKGEIKKMLLSHVNTNYVLK